MSVEKGYLVKYIHSELQPKEFENTEPRISGLKVDLFPCRKEQDAQNSADWVSDRILGEPKAEEMRATGQWNHPEVLTGGDTGLLEVPHGWDTGSAPNIEGRFQEADDLPRPDIN